MDLHFGFRLPAWQSHVYPVVFLLLVLMLPLGIDISEVTIPFFVFTFGYPINNEDSAGRPSFQ